MKLNRNFLILIFFGLNFIGLNALNLDPINYYPTDKDVKTAILNLMRDGIKKRKITYKMVCRNTRSWEHPSNKQVNKVLMNINI